MASQSVLRTLLFTLAVTTSLFVVTAAGQVLFQTGGDDDVASVLRWCSLGWLMLLLAVVFLLVLALALRAVNDSTDTPPRQTPESE